MKPSDGTRPCAACVHVTTGRRQGSPPADTFVLEGERDGVGVGELLGCALDAVVGAPQAARMIATVQIPRCFNSQKTHRAAS